MSRIVPILKCLPILCIDYWWLNFSISNIHIPYKNRCVFTIDTQVKKSQIIPLGSVLNSRTLGGDGCNLRLNSAIFSMFYMVLRLFLDKFFRYLTFPSPSLGLTKWCNTPLRPLCALKSCTEIAECRVLWGSCFHKWWQPEESILL